jgi:release factor glutamine methyltransferase
VETVSAALAHMTKLLHDSDSPEIDAQLLLAHVLGKTRTWLYTWPDYELTELEQLRFQELCTQRAQGHPVAYLIGKREFWTFELQVNPAVLIPRPETELLVELALQLVTTADAKVADLGTGSGAIALALAHERPRWQVVATDLYPQALALARINTRQLNLTNLTLLAGSWCEPLADSDYHLIVSNPPYIDKDDPHMTQGDLRFEPHTALVAANKGLADIQRIAQQARDKLRSGGYLLLEHGWHQGLAVRNILDELGYIHVQTCQDYGGRDRVTLGCKVETAQDE